MRQIDFGGRKLCEVRQKYPREQVQTTQRVGLRLDLSPKQWRRSDEVRLADEWRKHRVLLLPNLPTSTSRLSYVIVRNNALQF